MNEYFAAAADVRRVLGDLADDADLMATADGRDKSPAASRARLARMIGRDAEEAPDGRLGAPRRLVRRGATARHLRRRIPAPVARRRAAAAPVVAAGAGEALAREVARRLGRDCLGFADLIGGGRDASLCAPAAAVALLLARRM